MIQKLFSVSDTGNSVIGITLVGSAFVSDHADAFLFDIRYGFCKISSRDCAAFADEERGLFSSLYILFSSSWFFNCHTLRDVCQSLVTVCEKELPGFLFFPDVSTIIPNHIYLPLL